jgi:hypothetical protein
MIRYKRRLPHWDAAGQRTFVTFRLYGSLPDTPFWQYESYDHLVRNDSEFGKIKRYIEGNPVKAGLADAPEMFLWSSAAPGGSPAAKQKL